MSAVQIGAVMVGYVALAIWGHELASSDTWMLWYPAPGLAVAAVALGGQRFAVPVVVAELIVSVAVFHVAGDLGTWRTVLDALLVGGTFVVAGLAIRWARIDRRLTDLTDIALLVCVVVAAGAAAAFVRASIADDAGILVDGYSRAAKRWFEGDVLGMLSVAPAVLVGVSLGRRDSRLVPRPRIVSWLGLVEIASALAVPVAAVQLLPTVDALYACLVPVVFVAVRRAQPGTAIAAAATAATLATTLAVTGEPFSRRGVVVLLGVIAVTGMVAGLVAARQFQSILRNQRLGDALEQSDDIVILAALTGAPRWWNPAAARFLLRSRDGAPAGVGDALLGGADRADQLARHVADGTSWSGDHVLVDAGGREVPVSLTVVPDVDDRDEVVGYALFARDVTAAKAYEDHLGEGALHDELTGLPNRALLVEHIGHACERLRRSRRQSALLLVDIDRFGVVNESLGRGAGDELLRALADRLRSRVRAGDTLARLGGDEFVLLAEELDGFDAIIALADGILDALREPFTLSSGAVVAVASLGVVRIDPDHGADELIRRADVAMYRAKAEGGARYAVYDGRLTKSADRRLLLETSLRRSLADRSLTLHYQPVIDLRTGGGLVFAEALLRVDSPGIGPVAPPEVVTVAQETGLLPELGRLILDAALREAGSWPTSTAVSVNLSPSQVLDGDVADVVEKALRRSGFDPTRLIVEVSEDAFLGDPVSSTAALHRCRDLGVRIALDDFGSGWSSLATLRSLPIDILKLDQSLLTGLGGSPQSRAIAGAVLGVAEVLDVVVAAEGIETEQQLEISRTLGCQLGQGHRIGRPAPATDLDDWLHAARL